MTQKTLDRIALKISDEVFAQWNLDYHLGKTCSSFYKQSKSKGLEFDIDATIYFGNVNGQPILGFTSFDSTGADSRDFDNDDNSQTPFIIIDFGIEAAWLPEYFSELYFHLVDVVRHEIEHITQGGSYNYKPGKPDEDDTLMRNLINAGMLPKHTYLLLPKEIDANLQGLRIEAKKRRESFDAVIDKYLNTQEYLTPETRAEVIDKWRLRAKQIGGIPKF